MSIKLLDAATPIYALEESHRFIKDCLKAVGAPESHAEALADLLIEADYRGHYSHGMNRIEMYLSEIQNDVCDPKAVPEILKETSATAWIEGNRAIGAVVGKFAMDLAMKKAKDVGVGFVVAKGSNHYGIAGMYAMQALKQDLIGFSCTNTSPVVAPTRSDKSVLGTNPISLAAPALEDDSFVLDMATSAVALGKIEMQNRKNQPIPEGWLTSTNALYPLGGKEINSGYKGSGLSMMVEVLCGILGGGTYGPNTRSIGDFTKKGNLCHCFIAVDPKCFAPDFEGRLSDLMSFIRNMEPTDPEKPVLVAGDPERLHMLKVDRAGGVRYVEDQIKTCHKIARELNVEPLKPLEVDLPEYFSY